MVGSCGVDGVPAVEETCSLGRGLQNSELEDVMLELAKMVFTDAGERKTGLGGV